MVGSKGGWVGVVGSKGGWVGVVEVQGWVGGGGVQWVGG